MSDVTAIVLLSLVGGVLGLVGGVVFLYVKPWSKVLSKYSMPFAAGVLLTVALVGLIPEAFHALGEVALIITLLAFLASYLFENFVMDIHHHDDQAHGGIKGSVYLVIVGDTIHNFIDGVAIAAAYLVSPGLGLITALSSFLHEVPHEIGDFGILLKAGWKKRKILWVNVLAALSTVLGALMVVTLVQNETVIGVLLAVAAGMFLYLGASDFLPHATEGVKKNTAVASMLLGVTIMMAIFLLVPHSHDHDEDGHAHGTTTEHSDHDDELEHAEEGELAEDDHDHDHDHDH